MTETTLATESLLVTIGKDKDVFTAIFEFDVTPEQQERMKTELPHIVSTVVSKQPGFVSANLHCSLDGEKVYNYFQWESEAHFKAFRANEEVQAKVMAVIGPYGPKPRPFKIVFTKVGGGD